MGWFVCLCGGAWCNFPGKTAGSLSAGVVRHTVTNHVTSHLLCLGGSVKGYESIVSPFEAAKMEEEASQGGKEVIRIVAFIDIPIC